MTEVYEVATFYAHFDVVKEGETPPPPVTVRVCDSLSCAMAGAEHLLQRFAGNARPGCARRARALHGRLRSRAGLRRRPCAGDAARRATRSQPRRKPTRMRTRYDARHRFRRLSGGRRLSRCSQDCLAGKRTRDELIKIVSDAGLRGLGGAGFPTGRKWSLVRAEPAPRLMAVNGDEGEPGTFKDRYYLEPRSAPLHRRHADRRLGGRGGRHLHLHPRRISRAAPDAARGDRQASSAPGLATHTKIHLRRGAGAYICGEESAMIESIEGKRGLPRHRPPYVAQVGLFGRPTLEQNVETLYWVRDIVEKGAGVVHLARPPRAQGLPQLLGVRPRQEARRGAGAGRRHRARADRRISAAAWPTATPSRAICRAAPRAASCRRRWPTSRSISARWKNTAASSAPTRL